MSPPAVAFTSAADDDPPLPPLEPLELLELLEPLELPQPAAPRVPAAAATATHVHSFSRIANFLLVGITARPPCARAITSTIERPRPAPPSPRWSSARAKRSNARPANPSGKPGPRSDTASVTRPSAVDADRRTSPAP